MNNLNMSNFCSYSVNGDFMCYGNDIEKFDNSLPSPTPSIMVNTNSPSTSTPSVMTNSPRTSTPSVTTMTNTNITTSSARILPNPIGDKYHNCPLLALQNQCTIDSSYMLLNCPVSCNAVATKSDINCQSLVANKSCVTDPKEMINLCPKSCINSVEM